MYIKPQKIRFDVSTICQLRCPTCKTTDGITARDLGSQTLKFERFKSFMDANPWVRNVELSSQGEIFLNKDLLKIIEYGYQKNIILSAATGTNLNTISEEMMEGLVKYQFSLLTCAIDGASSETYKIYRRRGDFDKVIANIKRINEFKLKYRSKLPILRWQFIPFGHNEHEILKAKQMALNLDMEFSIKIAWGDFSPVKNKELVRKVTGLSATSRDEYREAYGKVNLADRVCSQMWLQPQINTDGRVLGCCINHFGDYGNVFREDLLTILNSEKMNYARDMLLGRKPERDDIPCVRCPLYNEMKMTDCRLFSVRSETADIRDVS